MQHQKLIAGCGSTNSNAEEAGLHGRAAQLAVLKRQAPAAAGSPAMGKQWGMGRGDYLYLYFYIYIYIYTTIKRPNVTSPTSTRQSAHRITLDVRSDPLTIMQLSTFYQTYYNQINGSNQMFCRQTPTSRLLHILTMTPPSSE